MTYERNPLMKEIIRIAEINDFQIVKEITHNTILNIYPKYYPAGAIQFFIKHHSDEKILDDIKNRKVYLMESDNEPVGTVTFSDNEIERLFVLPKHQRKGYGSKLMDFAEETIFSKYESIILDASLVAKKLYLKRGFEIIKYDSVKTAAGDYICYDSMRKTVMTNTYVKAI